MTCLENLTEQEWLNAGDNEIALMLMQIYSDVKFPLQDSEFRLLLCAVASHNVLDGTDIGYAIFRAEEYALHTFKKYANPQSQCQAEESVRYMMLRINQMMNTEKERLVSRVATPRVSSEILRQWGAVTLAETCTQIENYNPHVSLCETWQRGWSAAPIRDVVGNFFRKPLPEKPSWLSRDVQMLAWEAVQTRQEFQLDPVRLRILADALMDAQCDDVERILHLQCSEQTHWTGCWAVCDLLKQSLVF